MQRLWSFLFDTRVIAVIGLAALAAFLFLGAETLQLTLYWALLILLLAVLVWGGVQLLRWRKERRAAQALEQAVDQQAVAAGHALGAHKQAEAQDLRERMRDAIRMLKTSRIGQHRGSAALYELPWYMIIGNPAAGKSTAVARSGLHFPLGDPSENIIQGVGGTRSCDWFFTSQGILLDTAGRYSVYEEDRAEWRSFLGLLRKHRPKAPINGILIAVSLAELRGQPANAVVDLAKRLRQRVQELTETLEVVAPVYLVFTKADLVAGFTEFFEGSQPEEQEKAWGATLPYDDQTNAQALQRFQSHFDTLVDGLKAASVARLSLHRGEELPPGLLAFPDEFASLKPALRSFVATLFEDNPYQFCPVLRGFYFTCAVIEGESRSSCAEKVAQRFRLSGSLPALRKQAPTAQGMFLKDLFTKVIFEDRNLVRQYTSRHKVRLRMASFAGGALTLGLLLSLWTWSYMGNRQWVASVQADLQKVQMLQKGRTDVAARMEALELISDRLAQLETLQRERPWSLSFGLFQGQAVEQQLRREYLAGLKELVLKPAAGEMESYLREVARHSAQDLQASTPAAGASAPAGMAPAAAAARPASTLYQQASALNADEAYNALKAYLMLAEPERIEPSVFSDQVTRFWRQWLEANREGQSREELVRGAEKLLAFMGTQLNRPGFPAVAMNHSVVDQSRELLRQVVKGLPARERVYAEIRARAAARYAPVSVARIVGDAGRSSLQGSRVVSGAFTREAWTGYVQSAIDDAANKELQAEDWVLKTAQRDDLTLEGSPEQVKRALVQLYKAEYASEWRRFVQDISVPEFASFEQAQQQMNVLGDPQQSPIGKVLQRVWDETAWDNPGLLNGKLSQGREGVLNWIKQRLFGQAPVQVEVKLEAPKAEIALGPIGKEFGSLQRVMVAADGQSALLKSYLESLGKLRARFNQMKNQGDPGPAARQLLQLTLEGQGSELVDALKLVDEQMLSGMPDNTRAVLRPMLVRPLQQSFAVLVPTAEQEINRVWQAQVYEPFQKQLAGKYPFSSSSRIEAAPADIAKVFGAQGAIAKFADQTLAGLVNRRGDTLQARTWGEQGIRLLPEFSTAFGSWMAGGEAAGGSAATAGAGGGAAADATQFEIQALPAPGLSEYTLEIDGQVLRYRNSAPQWVSFVSPSRQGAPGVKISGVDFEGRPVSFLEEPGGMGLQRMVEAAQKRKTPEGLHELRWTQGRLSVAVMLRLVRQAAGTGGPATAGASPGMSGMAALRGLTLPAQVVGQLGGEARQANAGATRTTPANGG